MTEGTELEKRLAQPRDQRLQRPAPMAHRILLLRRCLAEGLVELSALEEWIVAEPTSPAGRLEDRAFAHTLEDLGNRARMADQHQHAAIPCSASLRSPPPRAGAAARRYWPHPPGPDCRWPRPSAWTGHPAHPRAKEPRDRSRPRWWEVRFSGRSTRPCSGRWSRSCRSARACLPPGTRVTPARSGKTTSCPAASRTRRISRCLPALRVAASSLTTPARPAGL